MAKESWPGASPWLPARPTPARLAEAMQDCRGCPLYRDATQAVPGSGSPTASLLVLGEQPGDREDREGEPFVGPAGKVLDRALAEAGIDADEVYLTNAVKHFRWEGRRGSQRLHKNPARWQVAACGPWLVAEIDLVRPAGVVLLGGTAGKAVYGSAFKVGEARGHLRAWPDSFPVAQVPAWVLATTHPSAVLRAKDRDEAFAGLVSDLRVASASLRT